MQTNVLYKVKPTGKWKFSLSIKILVNKDFKKLLVQVRSIGIFCFLSKVFKLHTIFQSVNKILCHKSWC